MPPAAPRSRTLADGRRSLPANNRRYSTNEQLPGGNGCGFYAVYDGHGGYVRADLPPLRHLSFFPGPAVSMGALTLFARLPVGVCRRSARRASRRRRCRIF